MALTDNLLVFYKVNGLPDDSSGNGHNLTITGATYTDINDPVNDPALVGSHSLKGDGIDDKATNSDSGLDGLSALTISCFCSRTSGTSNRQIFAKGDPNLNTTFAYTFFAISSKFYFIISKGSSSTNVPALANLTLGQKYHLLGTWNGATMEFYIDNVLQGSAAFAGPMVNLDDNAQPLSLFWGNPIGYMHGKIDAAGVWNRAVTASERGELWNNGNGVEISSQSSIPLKMFYYRQMGR